MIGKVDTVLSFDPSSSAIGWAWMDSREMLLDSGAIRRPAVWPSWMRVRSMMEECRDTLAAHEASRIVVEVPGNAQAGARRGKYATPGVYAAAVGAVLEVCWSSNHTGVVSVESDLWTRMGGGAGKDKDKRNELIYAEYAIDKKTDRGGDQADAINLAKWYLIQCRTNPGTSRLCHLPRREFGKDGVYAIDRLTSANGYLRPVGVKEIPTG